MIPTFAEYDDLIADFYWPRTWPAEVARLRSLKSRVMLAGRYWSERGLALGAATLFNCAGHVEETLVRIAPDEQGGPSRLDRVRSAVSCYALAGNWPQAEAVLRALPGPIPVDPEEERLWNEARARWVWAGPRLGLLGRAFAERDFDRSSEIALQLAGAAPPRGLLWPLARHAMRLDDAARTARLTKLLVIGLPDELVFHVSAADHDRPGAMVDHARYVGSAFAEHPYALAFAAYRLLRNARIEEALLFADRCWPVAVGRETDPTSFTDGHLAFCAMAVAATRREAGDIDSAVGVLADGSSRTGDPDLRTYLAMLLVVVDDRRRAEQVLLEAMAVERRSSWTDLLLATLLLERDEHQRAAELLIRRVDTLRPRSAMAAPFWNNLGVALAVLGDIDGARRAFSEVPDEAPEASVARDNLDLVRRLEPGVLKLIPAEHLAAAGADELIRQVVRAAA